MAFKKSDNEVHGMSSVDATNYVRGALDLDYGYGSK